MDDVGDLVQQLAQVQDRLLALDPSDHAGKYALEKERDALRSRASEFASRVESERPVADIERELAALRAQVETINKAKIDMVMQSGGGTNAGAGADGMGGIVLNQQMAAASGLDRIKTRISHLESLLASVTASEVTSD
ncbi:MAG: hypothetical protein HKN07_14020, partial [Acidimicrobiia bacterium]|nr:hypothetical protein [Acidimicrobiia bacterium]